MLCLLQLSFMFMLTQNYNLIDRTKPRFALSSLPETESVLGTYIASSHLSASASPVGSAPSVQSRRNLQPVTVTMQSRWRLQFCSRTHMPKVVQPLWQTGVEPQTSLL